MLAYIDGPILVSMARALKLLLPMSSIDNNSFIIYAFAVNNSKKNTNEML